MIRLGELALFFAPLAAYILWRITIRRGMPGPSRLMLTVILALLLLFGAGLAYFGVHERDPAGTHYVPAELRNGRIVPGHGA
jgi:peptidoglycan/LPS O-acetylase OafA/YrhL